MISSAATVTDTAVALAKLERWLESVRCPGGYGGPVAHWWQNCLQYTGPGLDWRYEGITIGYLNLWESTGDDIWLKKARRCGNDLLRGQLPDGNFTNSSFELNPYPGGTPHEAACDLALIRLAETLRLAGLDGWELYLEAASRNLHGFYVERLWREEAKLFSDSVTEISFVPNKSATLVEALIALAKATKDYSIIEHYALPTIAAILDHQYSDPSSPLDGAIYQYSLLSSNNSHRFVEKFFPFYVARCIPALVAVHELTGDRDMLHAALRAGRFIARRRLKDGSFPQVVYRNGISSDYPRWIAGVADILRDLELLEPYGLEAPPNATREWLMKGQDACGGFRTAMGFQAQISQSNPLPAPDFRDILHVAGWNDKVFRYLTSRLPSGANLPQGPSIHPFESPCLFRGVVMSFFEDETEVALCKGPSKVYRWAKGEAWAETRMESLYLK